MRSTELSYTDRKIFEAIAAKRIADGKPVYGYFSPVAICKDPFVRDTLGNFGNIEDWLRDQSARGRMTCSVGGEPPRERFRITPSTAFDVGLLEIDDRAAFAAIEDVLHSLDSWFGVGLLIKQPALRELFGGGETLKLWLARQVGAGKLSYDAGKERWCVVC
ncbi:hypothetical protein [Bradyrhizobium manausense]|uniref:Uncharacterized protein n=1 Tax=Bradyrhizobium manausense TaxID=989370 RepID=A0A0R3D3Z7_9BRAD|nr:hypothetical protein [Bradyrhizobium manausense]KRQ03277.1 hypothetical protein AOQ71_31610 [Bradyrhizobium manausense]